MTDPILSVEGLTVIFKTDDGPVLAVDNTSFDLHHGEILAVVGESGSGKSVTALSILGLLPDTASLAGRITFGGENLAHEGRDQLRRLRGRRIAMIFQDPVAALDPVFSIGAQLDEAIRAGSRKQSRKARHQRAIELLRLVDIPEPERRLKDYPHQLSGGQLQRVVIAMALANNPDVLIADEPTTALDVTIQQGILDLLRRLNAETGTSILLITHDMGVVADIAQRVVVMQGGRVVETAPVHKLFAEPSHGYTTHLLSNIPGKSGKVAPATTTGAEPVLGVENLRVAYGSRLRGLKQVVGGVSFSIAPGEILGLVGESGSGKTSIGKALLGLVNAEADTIQFDGQNLARPAGILRSRIGAVFQSPSGSLNPRLTIGQSIAEPLVAHTRLSRSERDRAVEQLLDKVRLPSAWASRYPHQLSGGQKQRVAIARAIALQPRLLIADEPTSALDVSVQGEILSLLDDLRREAAFACLFITHDLNVVRELCNRVVVLHRGLVVEEGTTAAILDTPRQDYTRNLVLSAPVADPVQQELRRRQRGHAFGTTQNQPVSGNPDTQQHVPA